LSESQGCSCGMGPAGPSSSAALCINKCERKAAIRWPGACGRSSGVMGRARPPSSAGRLLQGGAVVLRPPSAGRRGRASQVKRLWEIVWRDGRGQTFFVSRSLHYQVRKEDGDRARAKGVRARWARQDLLRQPSACELGSMSGCVCVWNKGVGNIGCPRAVICG
jgi:hypothetical protein